MMNLRHVSTLRAARRDTERATQRNVRRMADESFAQHALTERRPYVWKCAQPGTWVYGFFVMLAPGAVIVYGDLGEAIFRMSEGSEDQVLAWLRGCVRGNESDYLLSKMQAGERGRICFYPGDALQSIARDRSRFREAVVECAKYGDLNEQAWREMADGETDAETIQAAYRRAAGAFWIVEALRCFMRLHDATIEAKAAG